MGRTVSGREVARTVSDPGRLCAGSAVAMRTKATAYLGVARITNLRECSFVRAGHPASPTPTLPERTDHLRQPQRGVAPVRVDRLTSGDGIPALDMENDRLVLLDRRRDLIDQAADVQADVALGLRLGRVVKGQETRAATALH